MKDESETRNRDPLPESFDNLDDLGAFWDTHSSADYEDEMEDVVAEVEISESRVYLPLETSLAKKLRARAQHEGTSTEELVERWLRERITAA